MTDHFSMFLIGWLFFLLIGAWVLINALIDLSAMHVRRWIEERWAAQSPTVNRLTDRH